MQIDVVANEGHMWCEVKDLESFGIGSNRWLGCPGHLPGGIFGLSPKPAGFCS